MKKHSIIPASLHNPGTQILTLSAAHFMVDLLGGTLPGVLPVALRHFNLNLGLGVVILTSMSIGCNIMQIPAALLDRHHRTPRLLALGLAMAGMIVLLAAMPETTPFFLICLLMLIVGAGIAIVHPLGLRGTQHKRFSRQRNRTVDQCASGQLLGIAGNVLPADSGGDSDSCPPVYECQTGAGPEQCAEAGGSGKGGAEGGAAAVEFPLSDADCLSAEHGIHHDSESSSDLAGE